MATKHNLTMVRGDTFAFSARFEGLASDLDAAYFTLKSSPDEAEPIVQKSIGDGIVKAETGLYSVRVAPEDTENLAKGRYYYDFEIHIGDDVQTIMLGIVDLIADVTRGM